MQSKQKYTNMSRIVHFLSSQRVWFWQTWKHTSKTTNIHHKESTHERDGKRELRSGVRNCFYSIQYSSKADSSVNTCNVSVHYITYRAGWQWIWAGQRLFVKTSLEGNTCFLDTGSNMGMAEKQMHSPQLMYWWRPHVAICATEEISLHIFPLSYQYICCFSF